MFTEEVVIPGVSSGWKNCIEIVNENMLIFGFRIYSGKYRLMAGEQVLDMAKYLHNICFSFGEVYSLR